MAAHDETISQNRRKLFKALSAAPVVATLAPGQAAAQQSAFQCLLKIAGENPSDPQMLPPSLRPDAGMACADGDCFAYLPVPKWDIVNPPPVVNPGSSKMCPVTHPLLGKTLAAVPTTGTADPGTYGNFVFMDVATGTPVTEQNLIQYDPSTDPSSINILEEDLSGTCLVGLVPSGNAYVLVESVVNNDRTDWSLTAPPRLATQWTAPGPGGSKPDGVYGITATCIVSVHPGVGTNYVFLKG